MNSNEVKRGARIFRYPGAKGRRGVVEIIHRHFSRDFIEYREPFCGAAGVALSIDAAINRWINDMNRNVMSVYVALQYRPDEFIKSCANIAPAKWCCITKRWLEETITSSRGTHYPARLHRLYHELLCDETADPALRFLFLNRCGMNGRVILDPRRRSRNHFSNPFGWSNDFIDRLTHTAELVKEMKITCSGFEMLFDEPSDKLVQIYADPPYVVDTLAAASAKLYEYGFSMADHVRLRDAVRRCQHNVLVSYDDHEIIRELYKEFYIHSASWSYTSCADRSKRQELLITNYPVNFAQ